MTVSSPRAFVYVRISEDRSGARGGVLRQREACLALAEQQGFYVAEVFEDNDVSAFKGGRRPAYEAMVSRLHEVDHVLVWHTDRLHRNVGELEQYIIASEKHGVLTHAEKGSSIDLSTPSGRMQARFFATIANYESDHKAERIRAKTEQTLREGRSPGGTRPFGWRVVRTDEDVAQKRGGRFELIEEEAEMIRKAIDDVLDGVPIGAILREWNDPNRPGGAVRTTMGNEWGHTTFRQMLYRPRNAGITFLERERRDASGQKESYREEVAHGLIPPIVPRHVWQAVVNRLESARQPATYSNKPRHLLSGIITCHCGAHLRLGHVGERSPNNDSPVRRSYRCRVRGKGHVGKQQEFADDAVLLAVRQLLFGFATESPHRYGDAGEDVKRLEVDRRELQATLDALPDAVTHQGLTLASATAIERKGLARLDEIDEELASLKRAPMSRWSFFGGQLWEDLHREFLEWDIDRKRAFIRENFAVSVTPHDQGSARTFDPHTVEITLLNGPHDGYSHDDREDDPGDPGADPGNDPYADPGAEPGDDPGDAQGNDPYAYSDDDPYDPGELWTGARVGPYYPNLLGPERLHERSAKFFSQVEELRVTEARVLGLVR